MDDALYTDDLDLSAVSTPEDLAALLRAVRLRADNPSLRTLEAKTRHDETPLSKTAVAEMLNGVRFPRKAVMVAFLRACGVPDNRMEPWQRAWERVASHEGEPARRGRTQVSSGRKVPPAAGWQPRRPAEEAESAAQAQRLHRSAGGTTAANPASAQETDSHLGHEAMWHFNDHTQITLVSYRLPPGQRPPSSDPGNPNYVRYADLADLDTLIEIYGAVRAHNPESQVAIRAAQDLSHQDVATHLVLIGGLAWEAVTPWFSLVFATPIVAGDPFERGAIIVRDPDGKLCEFGYTAVDDEVIEDVGFFVSGKNPSAPRRTLMIFGGITTRGVLGSALCFIDPEIRDRNEQYVMKRFPAGSTYCIVMKVPILNRDPLAPDLSKKENRLFEWCDVAAAAG